MVMLIFFIETFNMVDDRNQCHCKPLVTGKNCTDCVKGTWNLTQTNPMGCQSESFFDTSVDYSTNNFFGIFLTKH